MLDFFVCIKFILKSQLKQCLITLMSMTFDWRTSTLKTIHKDESRNLVCDEYCKKKWNSHG